MDNNRLAIFTEQMKTHLLKASERDARYKNLANNNVHPCNKLLRSLPLAKQCLYLGTENPPDKPGCGSCSTWNCAIHGKVKLTKCTQECTDWKQKHAEIIEPSESKLYRYARLSVRFDHFNLHPHIRGMRFNSSIIESGDGYLFAFRNGWEQSNIFLCRLDAEFRPVGECKLLQLGKKGAGVGREDPRLFRLNGFLHLWFIGYNGATTNVKFARVNEARMEVEDTFFPKLSPRNPQEKNWSFFDYQGVAHAVYSTTPNHRIIRMYGDGAEYLHSTPFNGKWSGGPMRGGASPVLHNGKFYHFFHGCTGHRGRIRYNMGLTVFSAEPPFEILRYTPHPLDEAGTQDNHDHDKDVLFPCGAVYKDGVWQVSHGIHDRWSEIRFYNAAWVESQLEESLNAEHT